MGSGMGGGWWQLQPKVNHQLPHRLANSSGKGRGCVQSLQHWRGLCLGSREMSLPRD